MNNRKIKFRVWDKKRNTFKLVKNVALYFGYQGDLLEPSDDEDLIFQQFTGLLDKNNKEIYEGDILKQIEIEENNITYAIVEYSTENAAFELIFKNGKLNFYYFDDFKYEIMGNIFENPELLEKK